MSVLRASGWASFNAGLPPSRSVAWEPAGDGKRAISLADNHLLLWDLQESCSQATVSDSGHRASVFRLPDQTLQVHSQHVRWFHTFRILTLTAKQARSRLAPRRSGDGLSPSGRKLPTRV